MTTKPTGWRMRESQHLAVGTMVTASVWGDQGYLDLSITEETRGFKFDVRTRMTAQEARKLAAHLLDAADALDHGGASLTSERPTDGAST